MRTHQNGDKTVRTKEGKKKKKMPNTTILVNKMNKAPTNDKSSNGAKSGRMRKRGRERNDFNSR